MKYVRSRVKIRASEDKPMRLEGYAYRFGDHGFADGMKERIDPGAFSSDDAMLLYQHDPMSVLGREGKNMEISEDQEGLRFTVDLPDTQSAKDIYSLVRAGIIDGVSVGMDARETESEMQGDMRVIKKTRLREISLTPNPVYQKTSVEARHEKEGLTPPGIL